MIPMMKVFDDTPVAVCRCWITQALLVDVAAVHLGTHSDALAAPTEAYPHLRWAKKSNCQSDFLPKIFSRQQASNHQH